MIPISLTLRGFLSYREEVQIDFTAFDLACIAGPNGAGKSSLLDAITYALFGKARKTDETLINLHPDVQAAFVELVFDYEGNRYRVQRTNPRNKSTVLEFQIARSNGTNEELPESEGPKWKTLTERTLRYTQNRIEETLRLDYETFINAAFFLQGKADQFTQQRPADRKKILSSILGLEIWEAYRSRAMERRKALEKEVVSLDARIGDIQSELEEEDSRRANLARLENEMERLEILRASQEGALENMRKIQATLDEQQKLVDSIARQLVEARQRVQNQEHRLNSRQSEKASFAEVLDREKDILAAHKELLETRKQLASWDATAKSFREQDMLRQEPLARIQAGQVKLETQIKALRLREKEAAGNLEKRPALSAQIEQVEQDLREKEEALQQKKQLEIELQHARQEQALAKADNPRLKREMSDLKARIDRLKEAAAQGATCPLCGQLLTVEHRSELIGTLEAQGKDKGDQYRNNVETLEKADQHLAELRTRMGRLGVNEGNIRELASTRSRLEEQLLQLDQGLEVWEKTGRVQLSALVEQLEKGSYAQDARRELEAVNAELKKIGYDAAEHDRVRKAVSGSTQVEEDMRLLERARAALEPIEREIEEMQQQIDQDNSAVQKQELEHQEAGAALKKSQAEAPNLYQAQREMLEVQEQENKVRMEVGAARQKVEVLEDLKLRNGELQAEKDERNVQIGMFKRLERAFGKNGVPALLIEQALPQIENKANELLERLSDGEMSVRFQTQRQLKSRNDMRETLDIQISDSAGLRDYEMFSGGEAFRVNFAIRLALSEVLARRSGARLQTLVIDEGFGSQDALGRQRLIEAINIVRKDFAKILVITHIDELKEAFPARLEVEKSPVGSQVSLM